APGERLAFLLHDARVRVLLTRTPLLSRFPTTPDQVLCLDAAWASLAPYDETAPRQRGQAEALAYVLYTSGSTGQPKGVMVSQRAVVTLLSALPRSLPLSRLQHVLALTPLSFDIAALELFLPLLTGARCVLLPQEAASDGQHLARQLAVQAITLLQATPTTWQLLLQSGWSGQPSLVILCGGEALSASLAHQLVARGQQVWNLYGPTETTFWSTGQRVEAGQPTIGIGRPLASTRVYVLDRRGQLVPPGVIGELSIGGAGVARGYLNQPALTAERFVPDPFGSAPGGRLYRTGDLGRYREDGTLEYVGRQDQQVKLRGYRIELGEIEAVLARHEAVRQAVVLLREESTGDRRLVAYVLAERQGEGVEAAVPLSAGALRSFLQEHLPAYMLPAAFVQVAAWPLTSSGKIDRRALSAGAGQLLDGSTGDGAARTPTEELLSHLWMQVLRREQVGTRDNFFELGGHSLLATRLLSRIRESLQVEVPLRLLFEYPTIAELARCLQGLRQERLHIPPLQPVPYEGDPPLSYAQERLWFLDQFEPGNPFYNLPLAVRLRGSLQLWARQESLRALEERHESLRTCIVSQQGHPRQRILSGGPPPLPLLDLNSLGEPEGEAT